MNNSECKSTDQMIFTDKGLARRVHVLKDRFVESLESYMTTFHSVGDIMSRLQQAVHTSVVCFNSPLAPR